MAKKKTKRTPAKTPKKRKRVKNLRDRRGGGGSGDWTITATKKSSGKKFYYAGGARLATELHQAVRFGSIIHARQVKDQILADFPTKLTGAYFWQEWPSPK
jgi:hypothetical protein